METTQTGAEGKTATTAGLPDPDFAKAAAAAGADNSGANKNEAEPKKTQEQKVYYLGDKKFSNEDELLAYTASLQEKAKKYEQIEGQINPAQPQVNKKKLSDLIFEDPEAAIEEIRTSVKTEIRNEDYQQRELVNLVNRFYNANPDLKGFEDIVDVTAGRLQKDVANLSEPERFSKIAQAVRTRLATIKGAQGSTEELSSSPAVTMGAGSGKPITTGATTKARMSFADQIREVQKKGKLTKA